MSKTLPDVEEENSKVYLDFQYESYNFSGDYSVQLGMMLLEAGLKAKIKEDIEC